MFTLNKEDRKIKKIIQKDKKIKLNKEDLKNLKKFIVDYNITSENTIKTIASLNQEDRKYLEQLMREYLPKILEIEKKSAHRNGIDDFINKVSCIISGGKGREQKDIGYKLSSNQMEFIGDSIEILIANSMPVYLSEELGEELADLSENGKYAIFMHRPHAILKEDLDNYILDVFSKGIINEGDGGYTGYNGSNHLDNTFLTCQSIVDLIYYAKVSCNTCYKGDNTIENNRGVVIAKIPKSVLKEGKNIWYKEEDNPHVCLLNPSYIDGFLHFECNDESKSIVSYTKNNYIVPDIELTEGDTSNIYYEGRTK